MRKSFKFRLYPTRKQSEALDREVAAAQRPYNAQAGDELYLQGVGEIRVKWHCQIKGKIKTVTVRRRGLWHACFSVAYEP